MPFRSVIFKAHRLIVSTGEGRVTLDDVLAHQDSLLRDPDFDPDFDQLVDATGVSAVALSAADLKRLVKNKVFSPASRIAVVVSSMFVFGMLRMTQTYQELSGSEPPISVFWDRASALKWLGITGDSDYFGQTQSRPKDSCE